MSEKEENTMENEINEENLDFALDFNTSSSIDRVTLKFLILYIPVLWFGGAFAVYMFQVMIDYMPLYLIVILLPIILLAIYHIFILACLFFTKLFLILINLIHLPKEGVFTTEKGDRDYEFWRIRTQLKKIGAWLLNNSPLPWLDVLAFRWFGVQIDVSSHLIDAWVDVEFIKFGRKVTVGQGAVVMSSMVVGKYLIIKESIFDDYTVIGGVSTIAPGTIIGKDTVIGAFSSTNYKQLLESAWIYFGIPGIKLKPNKFAEERRDVIVRRVVDDEMKYEEKKDVNIDKDKTKFVNQGGEE